MIRVLLSLPVVVPGTLGLGVVSMFLAVVDRSGRRARRIAGTWARCLLWLWGVEVVVRGGENVPLGPAVYAANHCSTLDIPILFGWLPADFRIIHKRSLYLLPLLGLYLYLGGHVGIDRVNPFRARRSLELAAARIAAGTSVAAFPEGTRSRDGRLQPFKKGSFVLALSAGADVVPVSIVGVKAVAPRGLLRLRSGTVTLIIHPPLTTRGRAPEEAAALAEEVRRIVEAGCGTA